MALLLTQQAFERKVVSIYGPDTYDLSLAVYTGTRRRIKVICKIHGVFEPVADPFLSGKGCPKCGDAKKGKYRKHSKEGMIAKFRAIFGDDYDYSLMEYVDIDTPIKIICPHGLFEMDPYHHLRGQGCLQCKRDKWLPSMIDKGTTRHNGLYGYGLVISSFVGSEEDVDIICPTHGVFRQSLYRHVAGAGCPKCSHMISKIEIAWLNYLQLPIEYHHRPIKIGNKTYRVDAFDPTNNTVYEFYGDFWHSNPKFYEPNDDHRAISNKTCGEVYRRTMNREDIIRGAGYRVITIWESDFKVILGSKPE